MKTNRLSLAIVVAAVLAATLTHAAPPPAPPPTTTATTTAAPELLIYVARHGETAWNAAHKLQGLTDIPLNEKGKHQAEALRDLLAGTHLDAVYSSTLSRSMETAKTASGVDPTKIDDLKERNWGKFQGQVVGEGPLHDEWDKRKRDANDALDGGESRVQFFERVSRGVKRVVSEHKTGTVLIVAHSGTNQMVLRELLGLTDEQSQQIDQANDEVYLVEIDAAGKQKPRLWKRITVEHLDQL